jgi:ATP-dependent Clp protease ATP-binding subunit ClpA
MFERFTDRARRVLVLAQEEARLLDHPFIGTEHILLGLVHEGDGVAAKALGSLGISLQAVREGSQDDRTGRKLCFGLPAVYSAGQKSAGAVAP